MAVYALTEPELKTKGMTCFVVERGTPGFSVGRIENKMGIRSAQVSELNFNDCRIPAANRITEHGKGFALAMKTLDGGRIGVAAQGLGLAKGAFEIARRYLMERQQFGKPLYKNQYLAFRMAELAVEIEMAEHLLYKAAVEKQEGKPYGLSAAMAKLACTDTAMHVTTEAVQMLGGNGFMKAYHVERMMRDRRSRRFMRAPTRSRSSSSAEACSAKREGAADRGLGVFRNLPAGRRDAGGIEKGSVCDPFLFPVHCGRKSPVDE